jgi:hypothetical protein
MEKLIANDSLDNRYVIVTVMGSSFGSGYGCSDRGS